MADALAPEFRIASRRNVPSMKTLLQHDATPHVSPVKVRPGSARKPDSLDVLHPDLV